MSHTFQDPETGYNACYNSDLSGDVLIHVPTGKVVLPAEVSEDMRCSVLIPGDFLIRLVGFYFLGRAQSFLEQIDPVKLLKQWGLRS